MRNKSQLGILIVLIVIVLLLAIVPPAHGASISARPHPLWETGRVTRFFMLAHANGEFGCTFTFRGGHWPFYDYHTGVFTGATRPETGLCFAASYTQRLMQAEIINDMVVWIAWS